MQRSKPKFRATGLYVAIALIAYALSGAVSNDIYLPGRRSSGLHLHYEAIPPALLGITLFALTFPLGYFRQSIWLDRTNRALQIGAALSMALALYFVINPSGKKLATVEECQATYAKLELFARESSGDSDAPNFLQELRSQCPTAPMLKSYFACIDRATKPVDVNNCNGESAMFFKRKNGT